MHIVGLAWIFVVVLMAAAEATSPQGSLLGAVFTLLLYGLLPLSIVLYILATPARRRARRAREADAEADAAEADPAPTGGPMPMPVEAGSGGTPSAAQRNARGQAPGDGLPPV